jgi:hypothetical protein
LRCINHQVSTGAAPKTWDATVSFDSEDAAYEAANYVRAFMPVRAAPHMASIGRHREMAGSTGVSGRARAASSVSLLFFSCCMLSPRASRYDGKTSICGET